MKAAKDGDADGDATAPAAGPVAKAVAKDGRKTADSQYEWVSTKNTPAIWVEAWLEGANAKFNS